MNRNTPLLVGILIILIFFIGCRPIYHFDTAQQVALNTTVTHDPLEDLTTIHGPMAAAPEKSLRYFLIATYQRNKNLSYDLVVIQHRGHTQGPAYYQKAIDSHGTTFTIKRDSFQSYGNEYFGIPISRRYLIEHQEKGMVFKLFSSRDETALTVEPLYIQGVLQKAKESGFPL